MELKPIRDEAGYRAPLAEVEALWEAPDGSPEADRLEVLALLVEAYGTPITQLLPRTPSRYDRFPSLGKSHRSKRMPRLGV
jgi:antitoxin component HigA of HigAB toxin-antitoxin module